MSSGELQFAKRISRIRVRKLKRRSKKFEFKSAWNQILIYQNHVQVDYLEREIRDEDFGIGFTGFGRTVKKLRGFEDQGLIYDKNIRG